MPYDSVIYGDDVSALIPVEVSNEIISKLPESSAVMRLARRLPNMSSSQVRTPVMSALATAYPVNGPKGLKQTTEVNWENKYIDAEEIAAIVPIPAAYLEDSNYDIWAEVRPQIQEAIGKVVDAMVMYGTGIWSTWTTNLGAAGLVALATAASQVVSLAAYTDLYEALLGETGAGVPGVIGKIEADGFMATGYIAHLSMRSKLRNCRDADGQPIFKRSMQDGTPYELDGSPILFPTNGSVSSIYLLMAGQWDQLVYRIRQDIRYEVFKEGVIQDGTGAITHNLMQQDMVALRATIRLGFALPNPINRVQETAASRCPFAFLTA